MEPRMNTDKKYPQNRTRMTRIARIFTDTFIRVIRAIRVPLDLTWKITIAVSYDAKRSLSYFADETDEYRTISGRIKEGYILQTSVISYKFRISFG